MIIPIFSDLHLHNYPEFSHTLANGMNSRLANGLSVLRRIREYSEANDLKYVLFGGDLFHKRGVLPVALYQALYEEIAKYHAAGITLVLIVGNHDQATLDGEVHALKAFSKVALVVDTPQKVTLKGANPALDVLVQCVPYMEDPAAFKEALYAKADILIAHGAINGAVTGPVEYQPEHPLEVSDLPDSYEFVFLGHYHRRQKLADKTWYIGSPMQNNRGECDEAEKGFLLYNSKTRTFRNMPLGLPEFRSLVWDGSGPFAGVKGNFVDVEIDLGKFDLSEVAAALAADGAEEVNPIPVTREKRVVPRLDVDLSMDLGTLVEKYVEEYAPDGLDHAEVIKQAKRFLGVT